MYAAVTVFLFMCWTATATADHHQPCHTPNMTGVISVSEIRSGATHSGDFTYDSVAKKLRLRTSVTAHSHIKNVTKNLDLLIFFEEGVLYDIDAKNQSCEKKTLRSALNTLEIPPKSTFLSKITLGSATVAGEGLVLSVWMGPVPDLKANYIVSVTNGCLPLSSMYFSDTTTNIISLMQIETEIKDPDLLTLPSFCEGEAVEEMPEGTADSFLKLFL